MTDEEAKAPENPYDFTDPYAADAASAAEDAKQAAESDPGDESDAPEPEPADPAEDEESEEPDPSSRPQPTAKAAAEPKREPELESAEQGFDPAFDPRQFLDEELATKVFSVVQQQQREIARLKEMLDGAGIMAPRDAAISKVGEQFPDVFGKGSPSAEQSEARERLSDAADMLRSTYVKRGKAAPGWEELLRVAMSVEFPDLARKAASLDAKAARRETQRIARPASRETGLSREERAVRAARKMMLESAAFGSEVPDLG